MFELTQTAVLCPWQGNAQDRAWHGFDAYRTALPFWHGLPELRSDPRFITCCARLGLVEYWLTAQKWPGYADEVPYDFRAECEKYRDFAKDVFFAAA